MMTAVVRVDLHRLVDSLPEGELSVAYRVLEALSRAAPRDPLYSHADAPLDDEVTTPEEDAEAAEAWREYQRGETLSAEAARRLLLP